MKGRDGGGFGLESPPPISIRNSRRLLAHDLFQLCKTIWWRRRRQEEEEEEEEEGCGWGGAAEDVTVTFRMYWRWRSPPDKAILFTDSRFYSEACTARPPSLVFFFVSW